MPQPTDLKDLPEIDIDKLSSDEVDKLIMPPADKPAPEPLKTDAVIPAEPAKKDEEGIKAADKPVVDPPEKKDEPLLAGKYKDESALFKGVDEISKALNIPEAVMKKLIDPLKEGKNIKEIEKTYLELQSEYDRRKASPKPDPVPDKATSDPADFMAMPAPERARVYAEALKHTDLKLVFEEAGLELPTDKQIQMLMEGNFLQDKYLRSLKLEFGGYFDLMVNKLADTAEFANNFLSQKKVLTTAKSESIKSIGEITKKYGIEIPPDQIASEIEEIVKNGGQYIFDNSTGVPLAKADAIVNLWKAVNFDKHIENIRISAIREGRTQHEQDLEDLRNKTHDGIGTGGTGARGSREPDKLDLDDDAVIDSLTPEQLDNLIMGKTKI